MTDHLTIAGRGQVREDGSLVPVAAALTMTTYGP